MEKKQTNDRTPAGTDEATAELIDRARSGDSESFNRLFRKYEDTIFSFAFKVCRDRNDAGETLQDTYVNVFRNLKQFDGRSKFSTWLYSIVVNNCLMKRRRGKLEKNAVSIEEIIARERGSDRGHDGNMPSEPLPRWRNTPLEQAMDSELKTRLDKAIMKLPLDYRLVFILRDLEGKSAEETSRITKLTVPAVKSRLRRARVFLREELNEYMTS
ncbi:MAG TPA: sigma-70 family RNA polymerase sigma factor [Bacteroidota bacterium]|nr:sigma-70 family RNA polymerase sigma factor [Bacteroidota bacterium]